MIESPRARARRFARLGLLALTALAVPLSAAMSLSAAAALAPMGDPLGNAVSYLGSRQLPDGAFPGLSGEADAGYTADAIVALAAAREDGIVAGDAMAKAAAWLKANGAAQATLNAGEAGRVLMAAVAAGMDPTDVDGVNLLEAAKAPAPADAPAPVAGMFGSTLYQHAMALVGLAAAGQDLDPALLEPFRGTQRPAGDWAFDGAQEPGKADSNTTAMIVQAFAALGAADDPAMERALTSLEAYRLPDGGFAFQQVEDMKADAISTALVVQAVLATGGNPESDRWGKAASELLEFADDDGSFRFLEQDTEPSLVALLQAIPALAEDPYPVSQACDEGQDPASGCIAIAASA